MSVSLLSRGQRRTAGFSLLEVILALAILGGALAVLGRIIQIGVRTARESRGRVAAQLQCQSILAEIACGLRPPEPTAPAPVEYPDPEYDWMYTVEAEPTEMDGVLAVRVTVYENRPLETGPIRVSLVQWIVDPQFEAEMAGAEEEATGDTAESGTMQGEANANPGTGGSAASPGGSNSGGSR